MGEREKQVSVRDASGGGGDVDSAKPETLSLKEKLEILPSEPGVYIFRDAKGKVIYIGKAKVLRNRVRSYFSGGPDGRYQYDLLISRIADLETIVTDSEIGALILEANLIRRHHPRFNIEVRDEHTYPYLKVTREPYPRVFLTRQPKDDDAKYYGPLSDVARVRETVGELRKACQIRTCSLKISGKSIAAKKHKLCLEYDLGNCGGPCVGLVGEEEYGAGVERMVKTIHGKSGELIGFLERRMKKLSAELNFEEAARVRDRIAVAKQLSQHQKVLSRSSENQDVFGMAQEDQDGCIAVLKIRDGRLVGRTRSFLSRLGDRDSGEIWSRFLADYYLPQTRIVPERVVLPVELPGEESGVLREFLERRREGKVELAVPKRGSKARLVELARHNAELLLAEHRLAKAKQDRIPHSLKMLQEHLELEKLPQVIECFDNSNLLGTHPVAAMVRFRDARPEKSQYRHYRIKTVEGIDDFASMQEVVGRRYRRLLEEGGDLPDLVLIDGGIGQINAARKVLDDLGLMGLPAVGLAKRLEEIIQPGAPGSITLPKTSSALKLLMRIRDEAHRFAITFHRRLRLGSTVSGALTSVDGIGEAKARALLRRFGSLKRLKQATPEQIAEVPGFSVEGGRRLLEELDDA